MADAPANATPLEAITAGLQAAARQMQPRRESLLQHAAVIATHPELRERELIRQASMSAALADTLRARGPADPAATLAAEVSIVVMRVAFERWISPANDRQLEQLIAESLDQIETLAH